MRMNGSWHRYRPGETWRRPPSRAALVLEVPGAVAVCFDAPVVELFERRLTPELESKLIERMTEALLEVLDAPELKEHTWVIVEGHDAHRWGRNAKPWDEGGS